MQKYDKRIYIKNLNKLKDIEKKYKLKKEKTYLDFEKNK